MWNLKSDPNKMPTFVTTAHDVHYRKNERMKTVAAFKSISSFQNVTGLGCHACSESSANSLLKQT